ADTAALAGGLLGGHVLRRPHDGPALRQPGLTVEALGEAKVGDLGDPFHRGERRERRGRRKRRNRSANSFLARWSPLLLFFLFLCLSLCALRALRGESSLQ